MLCFFALEAHLDASTYHHPHYSENNSVHNSCFLLVYFKDCHYAASDRHHVAEPLGILPLILPSPLLSGNSESAACNCCACSWCCLWLINELPDQRENLWSHWKFWPISFLYPCRVLCLYLWIQHNSYQKETMEKNNRKKKFCWRCNCLVTGHIQVCLCNGCESDICWTKHYCMM